ncbi:MAG: sigma-54 dependent transcriptional regulator [Chitinophagaceae bacterium]
MTGKILIVDDEEQLRKLLSRIITLEGFSVEQADSLRTAGSLVTRQDFDVVLCDVRLPDGNGIEFIRTLKKNQPLTEIILLTAFGNITDGVQAIKNGAFDYIVKGDNNDRIIPLLFQAAEKARDAKHSAVKVSRSSVQGFDQIIGSSPLLTQAKSLAAKVAATSSAVLLLGETGTGKEVFANAIHQNSPRREFAMVAINCSAFTRELLEGELFGHRAGAYTGALKDKKGLVEMANGGTLFLDEIGEMNIELQAKLLRVLENGEFIKLGDTKTSKVDLRIIAATNRDLRKDIEQGHFREDLFYRLNIFTIELPALRERPQDLPALAQTFLRLFEERYHRERMTISTAVMELFQRYEWKGNIRELKNVMERAVILAESGTIEPVNLPFELQAPSDKNSSALSLAEIERKHITAILRFTNGNKAKAARILEIGVATLYRKMDEYHLNN